MQGMCVHTQAGTHCTPHLPTSREQKLVADPETAFSGLRQDRVFFALKDAACVLAASLFLSLAWRLSEI